MSLTDQTVQTTGINWESLSAVVTAVVIVVGAFTGWIGRRIERAVNGLSDNLQAKLETKETVAKLDTRVARVEERIRRFYGHGRELQTGIIFR